MTDLIANGNIYQAMFEALESPGLLPLVRVTSEFMNAPVILTESSDQFLISSRISRCHRQPARPSISKQTAPDFNTADSNSAQHD